MVTFKFKSKKYRRRGDGICIRVEDGVLNLDEKKPADKKLIKYLREHRLNKANVPVNVGDWIEVGLEAEKTEGNLIDELIATDEDGLKAMVVDKAIMGGTKGELIAQILKEKQGED